MGYTPNFQYLAPGAATMPRANVIPYATLFQDKKYREEQKDKLAANQAAVNSAFEDVRAVNEHDENILKERSAYFETERDRILNDRKMSTADKYRAMNILGKEAANDQQLLAIRNWTNDYQANKKALEEQVNLMDDDVYRASMQRLEEANIGIGDQNQYRAYNKFSTIKGIETPDLATDAQTFLKGIKPDSGPIKYGEGQYLTRDAYGYLRNANNEKVSEKEAMEIAKGFILQSPKYKEYFNLKDRGAELNLRDYLSKQGMSTEEIDDEIQARKDKYGGTVYDKTKYIEEGVSPAVQYAAYSKTNANFVQDWQAKEAASALAKQKEEEELTPERVAGKSNLEGVTEPSTIKTAQNVQEKTITLQTEIDELEEQSKDPKKTPYQKEQLNTQIALKKASLANIDNAIESEITKQKNTSGSDAGRVYSQFDAIEKSGGYDIKTGSIDPYFGMGDEIVPGTNETYKEYMSHTFGADFDEAGELMTDKEAAIAMLMPLKKGIAPNLTDDEFNTAYRRAYKLNKLESDTYKVKYDSSGKAGMNYETEEFYEAFRSLFGGAPNFKMPTNQEELTELREAFSVGGNSYKMAKILKQQGLNEDKVSAVLSIMNGLKEFSDPESADIDELSKEIIEQTVKRKNNYITNYLNKTKEEIGTTATPVLNIPIIKNTESGKEKPMIDMYNNILKDINTNLNNFVVIDRETQKPVEDFTGLKIDELGAVGMDEIHFEDGSEQRLPIYVSGTRTVKDGSKTVTTPVTFTLYGDRKANEAIYGGIANYLEKGNFVDTPKESERDILTGLKPTNNRKEIDYAIDLLRKEHTVDSQFEMFNENLKIGNKSNFTISAANSKSLMNITIPVMKTGTKNYIFTADEKSNPILTLRKQLLSEKPQFKELMESLPARTADYQGFSNLDPESQRLLSSLITMQNSYKYLKANNFEIPIDSEEDAKLFLRHLEKTYQDILNNVNSTQNAVNTLLGM